MVRHPYASAFLLCMFVGALPGTAFAQTTQSWVYDALNHLEEEGYVDLGGRDPAQLPRDELVKIVAQGLHEIDHVQQGTLADEYGRITSLAIRDEVHLKLYREQERYALKAFEQAQSDARSAEEMLVRQSMRGVNRLEIMRPLQERASGARRNLQYTARDHALAQMRRQKAEIAYAKVQERQQAIFMSLTAMDDSDHTMGGVVGNGNGNAGSSGGGNASAGIMAEPLVSASVIDTAARLRSEFIEELTDGGYTDNERAEQQLYSSVRLPEVPEKRLKIDGQVRVDASRTAGIENGQSRARARARVYGDYNIDGNWHAIGMLEYEKTLTGGGGDKDGKLKLDRYYLTGRSGIFDVTAGVFGTTMAEGNIYDSKFRGIRLSTGVPITYTAEYGKIEKAKTAMGLTASYDAKTYKVEAGMYRFDKIGNATRNIYMLNYRKPIGIFDFGAMLLHGRDHAAGNGTGYVFTLEQSGAGAWRPGSSSYWLKYYHQPSATYVSHTMNGPADYMSFDASGRGPLRGGFRGWGMGWSYTVKKDLTFALEYYDLNDLTTGRRSRTIWGALTGYFKNYEE